MGYGLCVMGCVYRKLLVSDTLFVPQTVSL